MNRSCKYLSHSGAIRLPVFKTKLKASPIDRKYILCRPHGGFNDILCQIFLCWSYAKKNDRELWIDTMRSGMRDCLSNYFLESECFKFGVPDLDNIQSSFPKEIEGKEHSYEVTNIDTTNMVEKESGVPLTFCFEKHYEEDLLVHEQFGGGANSIKIAQKLQFQPNIRLQLKNHVNEFGRYNAIHVRHSDYKTDYKTFFSNILSEVDGKKIVLCTDSYECQQYALSYFNEIYLSSDIPDTLGKTLHQNPHLDSYQMNLKMLADLMILIHADKLFCTKTECGFFSGFCVLARGLRDKRPYGMFKKSLKKIKRLLLSCFGN